MDKYARVFADFRVDELEIYGEGEEGPPGTIRLARVSFGEHALIVIDSPPVHAFDFTPSVSLFVDFDDPPALERAFEQLSEDGKVLMPLGAYGFSQRFGWLSDAFGVSWQLNLP